MQSWLSLVFWFSSGWKKSQVSYLWDIRLAPASCQELVALPATLILNSHWQQHVTLIGLAMSQMNVTQLQYLMENKLHLRIICDSLEMDFFSAVCVGGGRYLVYFSNWRFQVSSKVFQLFGSILIKTNKTFTFTEGSQFMTICRCDWEDRAGTAARR